MLGPVLYAGGDFAVFIFQEGTESNQSVPWKRTGVSLQSAAVTRAREDGKEDNDTSVLPLSPDQTQTGIHLTPTWDRHKCQDRNGEGCSQWKCQSISALLDTPRAAAPSPARTQPCRRGSAASALHRAHHQTSVSLNFPKMTNLPLRKSH